jgi:outer membrane protein assembly factor BamB
VKKLLIAVLLLTAIPLLAFPGLRLRHRFAKIVRGPEWLQFDDPVEDEESADDQNLVTPELDRLRPVWKADLPETVDGSPVYVSGVRTDNGIRRDLLIVTTTAGRAMAVDAFSGAIIWTMVPPEGPRWTTSSPAVSPNRDVVYSYGLDGRIHRYSLSTGAEMIGDGWPQVLTLKGNVEKASSALAIVTTTDGRSYLYATVAGYPDPGDEGDYQGHLVVIDLETNQQKIFNAACSDKAFHFVENGDESNDCAHVQSGIWGRAPIAYDSTSNRIFITTSNGDYDADKGGFNWGDSVLALNPDGSTDRGTPLDSYTPAEYQFMQNQDLDFGSTSPVILPLAKGSRLPRLAVQSGKDSNLRLINLHDLSGKGGPRHVGGELSITPVPQRGVVLAKPAAWLAPDGTTWVIVATHRGTSGLALVVKDGVPTLEPRWVNAIDGATPVIVGGVIYMARNNELVALDPETGERIWSDNSIGKIHWQSPIVVDGRIYVADNERHLFAYDVR